MLAAPPNDGDIVDMYVSNPSDLIEIEDQNLVFTSENWDQPQVIRVNVAEDADFGTSDQVSTTLSVSVSVRDNPVVILDEPLPALSGSVQLLLRCPRGR